jgi:thiol-disulfide isomerase/thioredoxin
MQKTLTGVTLLISVSVLAQTADDREALASFAKKLERPAVTVAARTPVLLGKSSPRLEVSGWLSAPHPPVTAGRVLLIDFWSTSCAPCTAAFPNLQRIKSRFAQPDLQILAIHPDRAVRRERGPLGLPIPVERPAVEVLPQFLAEREFRLPVGIDRGGTTFDAFRIGIVPVYVIVDAAGVVRYESHDLPTDRDIAAAFVP